MHSFLDVLKQRRSIRSFSDKPVPEEMVEQIIEAGLYAPSGRGKQSPIIINVSDKEVRDQLSLLNAKVMGVDIDPFYGAPRVLVVLADKASMTYVQDGSLAMGNMMNEAAALGLGSCWIHRAKEEFETLFGQELLKSLGIEGEYEGIANLILGYPAVDNPEAAPRKDGRVYHI